MGYLTLACLMNMYRAWRAYINPLYKNCARSLKFARFEVLKVVLLNIKAFWEVMPIWCHIPEELDLQT